jgi:hypothetical protein
MSSKSAFQTHRRRALEAMAVALAALALTDSQNKTGEKS